MTVKKMSEEFIVPEREDHAGSNHTQPRRIAIYVIFDKDGKLDGFRRYYLAELRKETERIVAVVQGTLSPESRRELEALTDDFFVRDNTGLLTYAWQAGLEHIGWDVLAEYDELLMLNDSFFGPFFPLAELFRDVEKSDADFYGVMKNFEEKAYTQIAGRPLKHGHFRGSICYFYIIRKRLLHSHEFRKYWSRKPEIKCDWDTYFFNEMDFYDYVMDAGFKIDAYQSDTLKGYFFDNLSHNMCRLIEGDRIPFARIRPFGTDVKDQALSIGYASDPRSTLEYIDKHTDYDANLIWDFLLRTKNLSHIWNQLQLEYVVPRDSVEKPFTYGGKLAVILHVYYTDLVEKMAEYCSHFPENTDYYITTVHEDTQKAVEAEFSRRGLHFVCRARRNVGVAMSTLWVTYADVVTSGTYEYLCYFHDKKSPYAQFAMQGEQFAARCYENLFGTASVVRNIINLFEENPRLGVLGAPVPYHGEYFSVCWRNWKGNYQNTVDLAKTLGLNVSIEPSVMPVAPYGDMMWFRAEALKKAIGHGFTFNDFDVPYKTDFTFMHAIERIYSFCAQDSGYYYADVVNTDWARTDLVNYQYILGKIFDILLNKGMYPYSFESLKTILSGNNGVYSVDKNIKTVLRRCYLRYKFLSKITVGKRREHYRNKKKLFEHMLNEA